MKRFYIADGIQIILAIVLTGSMAYAMQPQASESVQDAPEVKIVQSTESKPQSSPETPEKAQDRQKKAPKKLTWQDNPKKCNQDTQYIAADPPFDCIDKPQSVKQPARTESAAPTAAKSASISGGKKDWMRAAGIPKSEWWAVDSIVKRESGWNPNAVNPSSGACGLGQQLPCGKWAGAWNDPVAALKGQYRYVTARYGGYSQAVAFWNSNHWY